MRVMPDLLERSVHAPLGVDGDEGLARAELRRQIGRLERELAGLFAEAFLRTEIESGVPASGEPRVLGLGELERVRDALVARIAEARLTLRERAEVETGNRDLLERMLADPADFKGVRVYNRDIGEPGCGYFESRPRVGLLGMLMGWWRVKISSGCPL
jgi:hypothetical protein